MNVLFKSRDEFLAADPRRSGPEHDVATLEWGRYIDVRFIPSTNELYAVYRESGGVELLGKIESADLAQALLLVPGWRAKDMTWVRGRILTAPTDSAAIEAAFAEQRRLWDACQAGDNG